MENLLFLGVPILKHIRVFSSKDKSIKVKCCLLQFLFGALRVNFAHIYSLNNQVARVWHIVLWPCICVCVGYYIHLYIQLDVH